ncbi:phosphotransferase [Phenylobacterium sp.]|uniref:phosphotransferase n=1 Tax=Phenylobacterium sp. TaxID=1871053 RepID=UPI002B64D2CC|nr:phosphotransferase [Phenylobacterium sp.]HVI30952.1 phosphotransferase [Phenylobacterium sp.]
MTLLLRPDIRPPSAVDGPWLTAVLREAGLDGVVRAARAEPVGTGQIGDSVRFHLDYARRGPGAPDTLVGKFPAAGAESRATGHALGNYLREVRFYQELAPRALVRTPRCYLAQVDEPTSDFVLIMEDLAPAEQGDQLSGVTLQQARLVVVEGARLHASHWGDERLDTLPWVSGSRAAPPSAATPDMVEALWLGFKARYAPRLKPEWVEVGDWLCRRFTDFGAAHDGPRCLTHNDFRPDNMMFGTARGGHPVTVLDWQSFAYGAGATDLAYFLAGALEPQVLVAHEAELLELYLRTLQSLGVTGYGMADLERHYARGAYLLFGTAFFAAMIVTQTERGDRMFLQMLGSAAEHMRRHGVVG